MDVLDRNSLPAVEPKTVFGCRELAKMPVSPGWGPVQSEVFPQLAKNPDYTHDPCGVGLERNGLLQQLFCQSKLDEDHFLRDLRGSQRSMAHCTI